MDCTHTLLSQILFHGFQGYGEKENEAWHFTLMENNLFSAVGIGPLREDNRKVMLLRFVTSFHWHFNSMSLGEAE